jgi:hypothetical protein
MVVAESRSQNFLLPSASCPLPFMIILEKMVIEGESKIINVRIVDDNLLIIIQL